MKRSRPSGNDAREEYRILIVDDDRDFGNSLNQLIELQGYQCTVVQSPSKAKKTAEQINPQVTLIDLRLGKQNGIELIGELKESNPDILCVLMTAYASLNIAISAFHEGVFEFLTKPIDDNALLRVLNRCFDRVSLQLAKKKAEEELQRSEERFRDLIEGSIQGILIHRNFKPLFVNRSMADMLGYSSQEEFMDEAESVESLLHPSEWEKVAGYELQRREGKPTPDIYETRFVNRNGSTIWMEVAARQVNWDGEAALQGTYIDITERKRAEEALQESKALLDSFFNFAPAGMALFDSELRYVKLNGTIADINGLSIEDHLQKRPREILPGTLGVAVEERFENLLRTGQSIMNEEISGETLSQPGVTRHWSHSFFPISGVEHSTKGIGVMMFEITKIKSIEEQLRQSQKMEALGTLAGGIAHDFNNILTPIIGFCELLMKKFDPEKEEHDYLATIFGSAQRATDLVSQILLYSRRGQTAKRECELGSFAKEVTKLMRSTLPKSISVTSRVSADLAPVFCDPSQIHQVLLNLCVNAGQAMPDVGKLGITVGNVELDRFECFAGTILSGYYVRLAVSDSGVGMEAETLSQIFDPFFTTKELGVGTGLGLSTVFGIVRDHNGGITVSSELGEGSTFEVFLPAAKRKRQSREPQASETKVSRGSETILFVDDEEAIVALGKTALERHGYNVTTSTDSRRALKRFKANPNRFDLVVTDQGMPNMKGERLAAEMRKTRADIPIILCTGYSETMTPESCKAIGINAFLYKPIELQELGRVVRAVLDDARQV